MRTLGTQVRLRRLLRVQADFQQRLALEAEPRHVAKAAAVRLIDLVAGVRATWLQESAGLHLGRLRGHVSRSLAAMEVAAASLEQPGADYASLFGELRDAGMPLVFFLRGLEESDELALGEWLEPAVLSRSA